MNKPVIPSRVRRHMPLISAILLGVGFAGALSWPHLFGTNPSKVWFGFILASLLVGGLYAYFGKR